MPAAIGGGRGGGLGGGLSGGGIGGPGACASVTLVTAEHAALPTGQHDDRRTTPSGVLALLKYCVTPHPLHDPSSELSARVTPA